MAGNTALNGLEAARQIAALSPETRARFDECMAQGWTGREQTTQAFRAIGSAIASKRQPIAETGKRKLFTFAEQLLKRGSPDVSNAVATGMLETIWTASQDSGFDLASLDPYLGPQARRYLTAWNDFNKTSLKGWSETSAMSAFDHCGH